MDACSDPRAHVPGSAVLGDAGVDSKWLQKKYADTRPPPRDVACTFYYAFAPPCAGPGLLACAYEWPSAARARAWGFREHHPAACGAFLHAAPVENDIMLENDESLLATNEYTFTVSRRSLLHAGKIYTKKQFLAVSNWKSYLHLNKLMCDEYQYISNKFRETFQVWLRQNPDTLYTLKLNVKKIEENEHHLQLLDVRSDIIYTIFTNITCVYINNSTYDILFVGKQADNNLRECSVCMQQDTFKTVNRKLKHIVEMHVIKNTDESAIVHTEASRTHVPASTALSPHNTNNDFEWYEGQAHRGMQQSGLLFLNKELLVWVETHECDDRTPQMPIMREKIYDWSDVRPSLTTGVPEYEVNVHWLNKIQLKNRSSIKKTFHVKISYDNEDDEDMNEKLEVENGHTCAYAYPMQLDKSGDYGAIHVYDSDNNMICTLNFVTKTCIPIPNRNQG